MIEKFDSYEEAALFAEQKQDEGYDAVVLDEGTGFLWGPHPAGGFRVQVADEPGTPVEDPLDPETQSEDDGLPHVIRAAVLVFLALGAFAALVSALVALESTLRLVVSAIAVGLVVLAGGYLIFRSW